MAKSVPSPFDNIRQPRQRAFLAAYATCGQITTAAKQAGCHRDCHYHWKKADPAYVEAFQLAHEMAIDAHVDECVSAPINSVYRPGA